MNKSILIINKSQFGYQTDYYNYSLYLNPKFNVYFICWDHGLKKKEIINIKVKYINTSKFKYINFILFIIRSIRLAKSTKYDLIILQYFPLVSLYRLFLRSKILLDIRTGSISPNSITRNLRNFVLRVETVFFSNISIISSELGNYLKLKSKYIYSLPLGAEMKTVRHTENKQFNLLYVGTFYNRRIEDTILGYKCFLEDVQYNIKSKYTIIGFGTKKEESTIIKVILENKLESFVKYIGRLSHDQLDNYYSDHNVGISYIPIIPYYNFQPPTKTYEYLMAGLMCLGTATHANKKVINNNNGILCEDNPKSFSNSLLCLYRSKNNFKPNDVAKSLQNYTWESIVNKELIPIIKEVIQK